jgi:hypothetical protein
VGLAISVCFKRADLIGCENINDHDMIYTAPLNLDANSISNISCAYGSCCISAIISVPGGKSCSKIGSPAPLVFAPTDGNTIREVGRTHGADLRDRDRWGQGFGHPNPYFRHQTPQFYSCPIRLVLYSVKINKLSSRLTSRVH